MYLKAFENLLGSIYDDRMLRFMMIESLEKEEMVRLLTERDPDFDPQIHKMAHYEMLGRQEYVKHIVSSYYISPLNDLKKSIEDYKRGEFEDLWGRKLDEDYGHEEGHTRCEKDFWEYLVWKFASDEDPHKISPRAIIPPIVMAMWETSNRTAAAMTEGLIKFFNPTILVPSDGDHYREMIQKEKDNYGLNKELESMEQEFDLMSYYDFCVQSLRIAHEKGDVDLIYNAI